jgi:hypothetical protein
MDTAPFTSTYTIGIPPSTQAEIDGILADLRTAVRKWGALADKLSAAMDAITEAVPLIQADVKEIADAAKNLHGTGPLGTKFGTQ